MTDQVGEKHHRAVLQRHDHEFSSGEILLKLSGQLANAPGDLFFGDENALKIREKVTR
jgi:hypothetical protein